MIGPYAAIVTICLVTLFLASRERFVDQAVDFHILQLHALALQMEECAMNGEIDPKSRFYRTVHSSASILGKATPAMIPGIFGLTVAIVRARRGSTGAAIEPAGSLEQRMMHAWISNIEGMMKYRSFPIFLLGKALRGMAYTLGLGARFMNWSLKFTGALSDLVREQESMSGRAIRA